MVDSFVSATSAGITDAGAEAASSYGWPQRPDSNGAVRSDMKLRRHFLPGLPATLAVLDFLFMFGMIAGFIFLIRDRLGFSTDIGSGSTVSAVTSIGLVSLLLAYATGCYRHDALIDFSTGTTRLAVGLGVGVLFLVPFMHFGLGYIFDELAFHSWSRSLTIALIGVGAGMCGGMLSRAMFLGMVRRQWLRRTILVIGTGRRARHLRGILDGDHHRLTQTFYLSESYLGGTPPTDIPGNEIETIVAKPDTTELVTLLNVDQVVLALDDSTGLYFDHLLPWKTNGIPIVDFNAFLERETGRVDISWTDPNWLLFSDGFHFGHFDRILKRLIDLGVSIGLLSLTFPALLIVAVAIVIDDFGPVFYWQQRVSQAGRSFWIIKFRTMRVDAEKQGAKWASENDPRNTRLGRILRRTRIDEIPQLFNVLKGDMSLVGPRPERPVFVEELSKRIRLYHLRHSVKAGLTGWAQINYPYGASLEDAERKLEYDIYYLKYFSVLRDLAIILQTLRILLFAKGGR